MRRNPNKYGSITKLSGSRSRPWMIRVTMYDSEGRRKQVPIDYAETREEAIIILAKYNDNPWNIDRNKVTLAELYNRWAEIKLPTLGSANRQNLKSAFNHLSKYYGTKYRSIRAYQMQDTIDNCGKGYSTQGIIKNLWGHLDKFAFETDIIEKMYSTLISASPVPETSREPFTKEQVEALWKIQDEPWVDTVLIFIYTGFRFTELIGMKREFVNLEEWYFQNGIKSTSGKGRIVPIHERIKPLVKRWYDKGDPYLFTYNGKIIPPVYYRKFWKGVMTKIGADKTPHEARHTFETFLDNEKANKKCIDMLMGHKSKDVGSRIYNHKTIDQLRDTVNLLK